MRWRLLLVIVATVVACRRDERPRPDPAKSPAKVSPFPSSLPGYDARIVAACTAASRKYCKRRNACSSAWVVAMHGTVAECEQATFWRCVIEAPPSSNVTKELIERCHEAKLTDTCVETFVRDPTCTPPGKLEDGSACRTDLECRGGACLTPVDGCGKCGTGSLGSPLGTRKLGDACVDWECDVTLSCVMGRCAPRANVGEPCTTWGGLLPGCLQPFARCKEPAGKCVRMNFAAVGESCGDIFDCAGEALCRDHRCVAFPGYGEACASDIACAHELQCVNGVCALPRRCN